MASAKFAMSLAEDLTQEFDNQELCDVMFTADGKTISAHKVVLKVRSKPLYEMASGWSHGNPPIAIEDNMSYDAFKTLLRYMYSGNIDLTNGNVFTFLAASTHFKMDFLEELCVDHISKLMGIENVCYYMNVAVDFKSMMLQEKCCKLFSEETAKICEQKSFKKLSQAALSALLDVDETNVIEFMLFIDIKLWMKQQCRDRGLSINGTNMRHVIGDALYKIRFPTMTVQDFANSVTTMKGFLTDTEMAQVFQKITVFDNGNISCPFPNKFRCKTSKYEVPFSDMEKLLKEEVLYNNVTKQHCDCSSALKIAKDQSDNTVINDSVLSLRLILQCCADLANTNGVAYKANPKNQAVRNEVYEEFLAWQDVTKSKNVSDIMAKFLEFRTKLDKIYKWSL